MLVLSIIVAMTIATAVVILFLKQFMQGDTESAINRLNQSYSEINKKKEELAAKIQEIEKEYQHRKEEAEQIAAKLRDEAEKEISSRREDILKKAHDEAERTVADAVSARGRIREELKKEEQLRMIDYCSDLLQLTLKETITQKLDALLIEDFLGEIEAIDMQHVPAGVNEIEMITRSEVSDELEKKIVAAIHKKLNRQVTLKKKADQGVIGGAILKFGTLVLDGSIAGRLKEAGTAKKRKIEETT